MKILQVRNVHEALPKALELLRATGVRRESRNGPVLQGPPVVTIYERPWERVIFWPQRDANPFFHLYEALWMLAGRQDCKPLARYAKNMLSFSDDGNILNGAYGYRWRRYFGYDQLAVIAVRLRENPEDRRCVLQMWGTTKDDVEGFSHDLGDSSKDVPCNVTATFQRDHEGKLNLVVFCRSNDIIWGAYGANAVQFSMLLEYMALWIGCPMGTYTQVSVNWHGYLNTIGGLDEISFGTEPYTVYRSVPMGPTILDVDRDINRILRVADEEDCLNQWVSPAPWAHDVGVMLRAHEWYRKHEGRERYTGALEVLTHGAPDHDWIVAGKQWMIRRLELWDAKQSLNG